jgi:hypothetical protein
MMTSILQYPFVNGTSFIVNNCLSCDNVKNSPVYNWILFGKIAESAYATPTYNPVITVPSGKNRYLTEVMTTAIPASSATVELAVNGILTITIPQSAKVISSDTAIATATILGTTTTITGVAAGTATITISDDRNTTISTIVVTVA